MNKEDMAVVFEVRAILHAIQALIQADNRLDETDVSIDRLAAVGIGKLDETFLER